MKLTKKKCINKAKRVKLNERNWINELILEKTILRQRE